MQIEQAPTFATLQSTVQSGAPRFSAGDAETSSDIEAAQRLRYRVEEMGVHDHLASHCLAPIEYRAFPRTRLAAVLSEVHSAPAITPLVRTYLHQGAWIGGEPAWDADFNTADLLFFLPLARVATGQARDNHSERKAA